MFCSKCGTKLEENARQCPNCGAPVAAKPASQQKTSRPLSGNTAEKTKGGVAKFFKNKLVLGGIGIAAVIVIIVMILLGQPKKINLENLVVANFSRYNTVGRANISWDTKKFDAELAKALGKNKSVLKTDAAYSFCRQAASFSVENSEGLSNGDEVVVKLEYNNDAVKNYKIQFTGSEVKFTVEGLKDLLEIDPFEELSVSFSGISPKGTIDYQYTGDTTYVNPQSFRFDKMQNLKNGDVVTVSLNYSEEDTVTSGYKFTETSKTYPVEGLDEYVDSYGKLTEDFLTHAKQESEDVIAAYVAGKYDSKSVLSPVSYAGYIFNTVKDASTIEGDDGLYNRLYLIYQGTVSHNEGAFLETTVYLPIRFRNIMSRKGEVSCEDKATIIGESDLSNTSRNDFHSYTTKGYTVPLTAYTDLVTACADRYSSETGDGFEKYGKYAPIEKLSDIKAEDMKTLTDQAQNMVQSYLAGNHPKYTVSGLTLAGEYLLTAKAQGGDFQKNNRLIVVYSATISNDSQEDFQPCTVYFPVQFEGVLNLPGDEFMYLARSGVLGDSGFVYREYSMNHHSSGYVEGARMFSDLVTANRVNYNYEVSDGLKALGQ